MSDKPERQVSEKVINEAVKAIQLAPLITAAQFERDTGLSRETARAGINKARELLKKNDAKIAEKARRVRERQVVKALDALDSQLTRLETLPGILQTLRNDTFDIDPDTGSVIGIKESIKGYNKEGDPIMNTPASVVNEYLEAESRILSEERIVTGIEAAEKAATAKAGQTNTSVTLAIPMTTADIDKIQPL